MIEAVLIATLCVPDLDQAAAAYGDWLGYSVAERGQVSAAQASAWQTPALTGRATLLLQPESGARCYLRFIEQAPLAGAKPFATQGWNVIESLVMDPDALETQLLNSPFRITGAAHDLSADGHVRAMQAEGPFGEPLYFTRISGERAERYGAAMSFVDRPFIVVVGGPDFLALQRFYGDVLGAPITPFGNSTVDVISNALDLPSATRYDIALAQLGAGHFNVELDGMPATTAERARRDGELPPGFAMLTVVVDRLDQIPGPFRAAAQRVDGAPYPPAATVAVGHGPAGEWLEFVATT